MTSSLVAMNKKQRPPQRLPKVQFELTWVAIGVFAGMLAGFILELATRRFKSNTMQLGGFAGSAAGALVETVRFWWRKRRLRQSAKMEVR